MENPDASVAAGGAAMAREAGTGTRATIVDRASSGHPPSIATLALDFIRDGDTTRLVGREHFGPLRVQKALHPEGPGLCHAVVVHPPGGVVGGDRLTITAHVGAGAQALLTTPGAAKWYRANGSMSQQSVRLSVDAGATLEWLPQESIFFDAAQVRLEHDVSLAADASYIGCELLCFGRTAAGESFGAGSVSQRTVIRRGGRLLWFEQGAIEAGTSAMDGPLGLAGHTVCATLLAVGDGMNAALVDAIRTAVANLPGAAAGFGVSLNRTVLVARSLGHSSAQARHLMLAVWAQVRPTLIRREAVIPRIWHT